MDFSSALLLLKGGEKLARSGWNGKGMFVKLQPHTTDSKMTRPYIYMTLPPGTTKQFGSNPDQKCELVPWLASQTDLLAEDWEVVK